MEQHILLTIAAILTIAIFSFLWKDNSLYKFAEHLVVGVSMGYWIVILYNTSLLPKLIDPLKRVVNGTSTTALEPLVIVPAILGILLFARFIPKYGWIMRIPIAYILGVGSGASIPLVLQTSVIQQIYPTMASFLPGAAWGLNRTTIVTRQVDTLCHVAEGHQPYGRAFLLRRSLLYL